MSSHDLMVDTFKSSDILCQFFLTLLDSCGCLKLDSMKEFPKNRVDSFCVQFSNFTKLIFYLQGFVEAIIPSKIIQISILYDFLEKSIWLRKKYRCHNKLLDSNNSMFRVSLKLKPGSSYLSTYTLIALIFFDKSSVMKQGCQ